jgi:hypothetical protein
LRPWSPWVDERWVGLLTTDTGTWLRASWKARCLFALLVRIANRGDGQLTLEGDARGAGMNDLEARLFAEGEDIRAPLDELEKLGFVSVIGCCIGIVGWIDGSDLPTGGYVRIYTRDTASWLGLSIWARGAWCLLLRSASRDGVHFLGAAGMIGLARLLRAPIAELQPVLDELLGPGGVDLIEKDAVAPEIRIVAFRDSQETGSSDATRQRATRERARAGGRNPASSVASHSTPSHGLSHPVTVCHTQSRSVTDRHSDPIQADPIKSDPNSPETTTPRPDRSSGVGVGARAVGAGEDAPSPPTSPSPTMPAPSPQARPRPVTPAFGWASEAEQLAGTQIVERILSAGAKAGDSRGPIAGIATPPIARSLLAFTSAEVCGCTGKLELADVLLGIDEIGVSEATRLLGPGELPKSNGDLSRYLRGGVSKRKRGDAQRKAAAAQDAKSPPLSAANLELAREAARWAWTNADSANHARIIDSADDGAFADLWAIAEREMGTDARWKDPLPTDIKRILAHWMLKYFKSNDRALADRGYPIAWILANGAARIKSYGLPSRRAAPTIKGDAATSRPEAASPSAAEQQIMQKMSVYLTLSDLVQLPGFISELAKMVQDRGATITQLLELLDAAPEGCLRQARRAPDWKRADIVRKFVSERLGDSLAQDLAAPKTN